MSGGNEVARNLLAQGPGRVTRHAIAADARNIPQLKRARHNGGNAYIVKTTGGDTFPIVVSGRVQWALKALCKARGEGITSFDNPAPRLAAYVHILRELGVEIETLREPHNGDFPGSHGRYVLRPGVSLDWKGAAI